jgi:phosphoribosylamine--glycine ligase
MYLGLSKRGHDVKVFVKDPAYQEIFRGMLRFTDDWRLELGWVRDAGDDGVVIFESADMGHEQDALRKEGFRVIGGSGFGDRLEADRDFGQQTLRSMGLHTASSHSFTGYDEAISFLHRFGGRHVLKFNGANSVRTRNYIGQLDDGGDMLALLKMYRDHASEGHATDFVLMEFLQGVEVGVGAYFNGKSFLEGVCIDFEHKRFFPGDLGELTGEMGTIVTYRGADKLFNSALLPLAEMLAESGYCGYINVNLIVNQNGIWPLEFTTRFGYPGYAICETLHSETWETIFLRMLNRDSLDMRTLAGFSAGIVLTVPPFPYTHGYDQLSKGEPICLRPGLNEEDIAKLHFAEVEMVGEHLITSGATGYVGVATGRGETVAAARDAAYRLARHVVVPNLRYRSDIGDRVIENDWRTLVSLGWLES